MTIQTFAYVALAFLALLFSAEVFLSDRNAKYGVRIVLSLAIVWQFNHLEWWWGFSAFFAAYAAISAVWWIIKPLIPQPPKLSFVWLYRLLGIPEGTNYVWWLIAKQSGFRRQTLALFGFIGLFWISFGNPIAAIAMIVSMYSHEAGHWLVFTSNKTKAKVYLLWPLGAVAAPINKEEDARSDLLPWWNIAWLLQAGPTVNVLLMVVGLLMIKVNIFSEFARQLVYLNGMLAAFNLLPIGNMDGGQLFGVIFSSLKEIYDVVVGLTAVAVSMLIVWGIMLSPVASGGLAILRATLSNIGLITFLLCFAAGVWHKQGKDDPLHSKSNQAMTVKQVGLQLAIYFLLVISTLYMVAL